MTYFMPLFPLKIIVFPNEILNLHIFEPRYKQLINDCVTQKSPFVIPSFIKETIELGTEVKITNVERIYDDGKMDVSVKGKRIMKILAYDNPIKGKLYAGGHVEELKNDNQTDSKKQADMITLIKKLFDKLNFLKEADLNKDTTVFEIAHRIGLSQKQEYELLGVTKESDRQDYVIRHLNKILPVFDELNKIRERIKKNGHFRRFDPMNF